MPLVRIDLREGKPAAYRRAVADAVHTAMVDIIGIPEADRFQVISEHGPEGLVYDPAYLGITRDDDVVLVQITISAGRAVELKRALYERIVTLLEARPGIRRGNVFVNLLEVSRENWSFGDGIAQYAVER
jgi:phenylpyruvate tautomerase PptA (4-oxalocrotonate tautomerase family)